MYYATIVVVWCWYVCVLYMYNPSPMYMYIRYMYMDGFMMLQEMWKERKKERHLRQIEKWKMRVASGGILCISEGQGVWTNTCMHVHVTHQRNDEHYMNL